MYLYTLTTNIKLVPFRNDVYQRSVRCPDIMKFVEPLIYNAKFLGGIFVKFFYGRTTGNLHRIILCMLLKQMRQYQS